MKTAIRTYHPIPALQRTEGNLQDAPRIKHILKASLLTEDGNMPPITPQDIVSRLVSVIVRITCLVIARRRLERRSKTFNQHHQPVVRFVQSFSRMSFPKLQRTRIKPPKQAVQKYFKPAEYFPLQLDFLDLFLRTEVSSPSRGRAFLWICWKFLEKHDDDASNPFSGPGGRVPAFELLSKEQSVLENIDPEEEKIIAEKLITSRNQIVINNSIKEAQKEAIRFPDDINQDLQSSVLDDRSKGHRGETSSTRNKAAQAAKERKALADKLRRERIREKREQLDDAQSDGDHGLDLVDRKLEQLSVVRFEVEHVSPQGPGIGGDTVITVNDKLTLCADLILHRAMPGMQARSQKALDINDVTRHTSSTDKMRHSCLASCKSCTKISLHQ